MKKTFNLMQQAANDPDFIARCNEVQKDFASIDYTANSDLPEEFIKELLVAKNAPTEPFEFHDENKLITRR